MATRRTPDRGPLRLLRPGETGGPGPLLRAGGGGRKKPPGKPGGWEWMRGMEPLSACVKGAEALFNRFPAAFRRQAPLRRKGGPHGFAGPWGEIRPALFSCVAYIVNGHWPGRQDRKKPTPAAWLPSFSESSITVGPGLIQKNQIVHILRGCAWNRKNMLNHRNNLLTVVLWTLSYHIRIGNARGN